MTEQNEKETEKNSPKMTKNSSFEEKSRKNSQDSTESPELKPGDLCWVKITGFPFWPCFLLDDRYAQYLGEKNIADLATDKFLKWNEKNKKFVNPKIIRNRESNCRFKSGIKFADFIEKGKMTTDDYLYFLNNYKNLNLKFCEKDVEYFYQNYKIKNFFPVFDRDKNEEKKNEENYDENDKKIEKKKSKSNDLNSNENSNNNFLQKKIKRAENEKISKKKTNKKNIKKFKIH